MVMGCFALQASANPGNPKKGTPEAELAEYVIELMHACLLTPSECGDLMDQAMGYDYGIMTLSMADPNGKKNGKKNNNSRGGGHLIEDDVPLALDPIIDDQLPVYSPDDYEDGGVPEYEIALPNGKIKMNNKYGNKIKIKKVK